MYSYSALEKSSKSEAAQPKRRVPTFKPLQAKEKDNGGLFGDTVHRRVMRGLSSDKRSTSPYLRGSNANAVQLKGIVQMANGRNAYQAGKGNGWHVHYKGHIKYRKSDKTRVDFAGRSKRKIFQDLGQTINREDRNIPGLIRSTGGDDFKDCINWIRDHIK